MLEVLLVAFLAFLLSVAFLLFVAFFVLAVYCISLVMPDVKKDLATDGALYQEIQQELDADEQSAQQKNN